MAYVLDADVFIQAQNRYYGLDFCPAFWDWILLEHAAGKVLSIRRVKDELMQKDDALSEWAKQHGGLFKETVNPTAMTLRAITQWAQEQNFMGAHLKEFLKGADYFLIAYASEQGHTVVTNEAMAAKRKKIKIPAVCKDLGVDCSSPFQMLKNEQARFVLEGLAQARVA